MSEIAASEKELDESSGTVLESSDHEGISDVVQNKAEEETTLELQTEGEEATLEPASVDVTVESNDPETESSSTTEYESCKDQESLISSSEEINDGSNDKDSDEDSDGEEDEDLDEDGTVTCALLGLEQAKVSLLCLALEIFQISDLFYVSIVKTKFVTDAC